VGVLTIGAMIYFIIRSKNDTSSSVQTDVQTDVQQREEVLDESSNYTTIDETDESIFDS
jgi:hypothetical protein